MKKKKEMGEVEAVADKFFWGGKKEETFKGGEKPLLDEGRIFMQTITKTPPRINEIKNEML
ncbi:hypothetical protein ISU75_18805 [Leptospira borgpetersenii serovar Hardjo-bovis]|nr:hypothetical protein [Leptospira borgpetersenii serovar Hardjo-bovis]